MIGRRRHLSDPLRAALGRETVLAEAAGVDVRLVATRTRLLADPDPNGGEQPLAWPWERVQAADWDRETDRLAVTDVGEYGAARQRIDVHLTDDAERFLRVLRERVSASVVLQRRVEMGGRLGFTVIGRRSPVGGPIAWMHEFDAGVDPDEPEVAASAAEALAAARDEVGDPI